MAIRKKLKNEWTKKEIDDDRGEFKQVTVPVMISFEGKHKVLDLSQAESILKSANLISLEPCTCRQKMMNCDAPVDDVCICVNGEAKTALSERQARNATFEEAKAVLEKTHKAGLVHVSFEMEGREMSAICSCCQCCCQSLAAMIRFGGYDGIVGPSDMIAVHDESRCSNCETCVERCQFDAWGVVAEKVRYYPGKCRGCGVCVSFCPERAIDFVKRSKTST